MFSCNKKGLPLVAIFWLVNYKICMMLSLAPAATDIVSEQAGGVGNETVFVRVFFYHRS